MTAGMVVTVMMVVTAKYGTDGCVALKDIAEKQNISKKYLEGITLQDILDHNAQGFDYII
jgi:DNA-binding IscR family transcriptional regulator